MHFSISIFTGLKVMPAMILAMTQAKASFSDDSSTRPIRRKTRTYFPETWIWECLFVDRHNGSFEVAAPDKISQWSAEIVGLSTSTGIGLSARDKRSVLTTSKAVFVEFLLPPRIIRGEQMRVAVSIHNLMQSGTHKMRLIIKIPKGVQFETAVASNTMTKTFCLKAGGLIASITDKH